MNITETPIYKVATEALEAKVHLEDEAKRAYDAIWEHPEDDAQMAMAFYYLSISEDLKAVEQFYAEATMNLIVACRALGIDPIIPAA